MAQMNASFKQEDHTNDPVSTQNPKSSRRTRGLDEIAPFLHQVNKIVSEALTSRSHPLVQHMGLVDATKSPPQDEYELDNVHNSS